MKAIIGQFYKDIKSAYNHAEKLKRMWKGRCVFIVVGNKEGYMVISESSARACGLDVPLKNRRYANT